MNSYELKISTSFGEVRVESFDFAYLQDVKTALDSVQANADKAEKAQMNSVIDMLFDAELKKQPAKKRGRPAGSTNKARKAK